MALETVSIDLNTNIYTQIGSGVFSLSSVAESGRPYRVHVVTAGGASPAAGTDGFVTVNSAQSGQFSYKGNAADIYAMGRDSSFPIKVMRE